MKCYLNLELLRLLNFSYRWRASQPGNVLDRRVDLAKKAQRVRLDSFLFISPTLNYIQQPVVQFVLLAIGVYLFTSATQLSLSLANYGIQRFQSYRLGNISIIQDEYSPHDVVNFLQLLRKGCVIYNQTISHSSRSVTVTFPNATDIDGFIISFNESISATISARFILFGSNDLWETETVVGSSDMSFGNNGIRFLDEPVRVAPQLLYDYRPPWPFVCESVLISLLLSTAFIAIAVFGHLHRPAAGRSCILALLCADAAISVCTLVGFLSLGLWRQALLSGVELLCYFFMVSVLALIEPLISEALAAAGLAKLAARVASDCALFQDCSLLVAEPPYAEIICIFVGVGLAVSRLRFCVQVLRAVSGDRSRLDSEWARLLLRPLAHRDLQLIADAAERACASFGHCPQLVMQCNREWTPHCRRRGSKTGSGGVQPTRSHSASGEGLAALPPAKMRRRLNFVQNLIRTAAGDGPGEACGHCYGCGTACQISGRSDPTLPVTSLDQLYSQVNPPYPYDRLYPPSLHSATRRL